MERISFASPHKEILTENKHVIVPPPRSNYYHETTPFLQMYPIFDIARFLFAYESVVMRERKYKGGLLFNLDGASFER